MTTVAATAAAAPYEGINDACIAGGAPPKAPVASMEDLRNIACNYARLLPPSDFVNHVVSLFKARHPSLAPRANVHMFKPENAANLDECISTLINDLLAKRKEQDQGEKQKEMPSQLGKD